MTQIGKYLHHMGKFGNDFVKKTAKLKPAKYQYVCSYNANYKCHQFLMDCTVFEQTLQYFNACQYFPAIKVVQYCIQMVA